MKLLKKLGLPTLIVILFTSNAFTLFNADAYNALYAALARFIPLSWQKNSHANKLAHRTKALKKIKAKTKKVSLRISKRTLRNISANLAAIPAESIPAVGIGVVVAITAMDLHDACSDLKDMDELALTVGVDNNKADTQKVCGFDITDFSSK